MGAAQDFGGSLGLASDNLYRGLSLSSDQPSWLADLHYTVNPDWVIGIGATAERYRHHAPGTQFTTYLDRRWQVNDEWATKLGLVHYGSIMGGAVTDHQYDELNAAIGYKGRWQATIAVSPNAPGSYYAFNRPRRGFVTWLETTWHQPVAERVSIDAGLGYARLERVGARNYGYANLGLIYGVGPVFIYFSRIWTGSTRTNYGPYAVNTPLRSRWVSSVVWVF